MISKEQLAEWKTSIEWTATVHPDGTVTPGSTWNPIRGCSRVSPGCEHCYAERVAARFSGPGQPYEGLATMHVRKRRGVCPSAGDPCGQARAQLSWVIAGAESGPGARPMNLDWVRSLRDQCAAAGVAFFLKQIADPEHAGEVISTPELDGR